MKTIINLFSLLGFMKIPSKHARSLGAMLSEPLHKNAVYLMINTLGTSALGFVFWIIVYRHYVPEDVGLAVSLISTIILLAVFSTLGLNIGLVRFLPESKMQDTTSLINTSLTVGALSSLLFAVIFILGTDLWTPELTIIKEHGIFILLFLIFTVTQTISLLIASVFVARRQAKWVFINDTLLSGCTKLFLIFLFLELKEVGIVSAWGISIAIGAIVSLSIILPRLYETYRPIVKIKLSGIREMLRFSMLNYICDILNRMPMLLMPLIIINLLSPSYAAYFYTPWLFASLLYAIPLSICTSLLAEGATDRENLSKSLKKAVKFLIIILLPAIPMIWILGYYLLLIFGQVYATNTLPLLRIFVIAVIPYSANVIFITLERIEKRMNLVILMYAIIATTTIGLSYLLIQKVGIIGIGWSWLIAHTIAQSVILFLKGKKFYSYFK